MCFLLSATAGFSKSESNTLQSTFATAAAPADKMLSSGNVCIPGTLAATPSTPTQAMDISLTDDVADVIKAVVGSKGMYVSVFTAQRYAIMVYVVVVCLSVHLSACPFVAHWNCIKTAEFRITQRMPHDSPGTVFL